MQETHRGLMDELPTQCLGGSGSLLDGSKQTTSFSVRNNPFPYDKLSVCCFGSIMTKNRLS